MISVTIQQIPFLCLSSSPLFSKSTQRWSALCYTYSNRRRLVCLSLPVSVCLLLPLSAFPCFSFPFFYPLIK